MALNLKLHEEMTTRNYIITVSIIAVLLFSLIYQLLLYFFIITIANFFALSVKWYFDHVTLNVIGVILNYY